MGVDHVFHAVGDDVARRQGIEHSVVPHGDAVVNGYRVEFRRITAQLLDFRLHQLADFVQVRVPRHKLGE